MVGYPGGGGGLYSGFQVVGTLSKNIFGFEICNSGILLSREIWYCIGWLDLSRDFLEYSKQSQDLSWLIFGPGFFGEF